VDPAAEEAARAELERAIELQPKSDRAHLFLGLIHRAAGRTREAEAAFERAIHCNPNCKEALAELRALHDT
jgi:Tfp pilus assembly protein PilF